MKFFKFFIVLLVLSSCSSKKQILYFDNSNKNNLIKVDYSQINQEIEPGDILKIDINTEIPEAAIPYKRNSSSLPFNDINLLMLEGYRVDFEGNISYPVLGEINVLNHSTYDLSTKIKNLLIDGGHLKNPYVKVTRLNSKFTVLGEVLRPGTFPFYDDNLNLFQALGYSGDLLITAKRKNVTLIREENGLRKTYKISLNDPNLLKKPFFQIKNNDVIVVNPNYAKIKSAGFIGSPQSIASISSLLLSITLLIINK